MEWICSEPLLRVADFNESGIHCADEERTCGSAIGVKLWEDSQTGKIQGYEEKSLDDSASLERWLANIPTAKGNGTSSVQYFLILITDRTRLGDGSVLPKSQRDPMAAGLVPFPEKVFAKALERLHIHTSIKRVVQRNTTTLFRRSLLPESPGFNPKSADMGKAIVYSCRSSSQTDNDMALTLTYYPKLQQGFGVLFGCTDFSLDEVRRYLDKLKQEGAAVHPALFFPMLFMEVERARLNAELENQGLNLRNAIIRMGSEPSVDNDARAKEIMEQFLHVGSVRSDMDSFKTELLKMKDHVEELKAAMKQGPEPQLRLLGRMGERLTEIVSEAEHWSRYGQGILDGTLLRTQMEWNRLARRDNQVTQEIADDSRLIASKTRKDGHQMRSLALLGMIFLPGTWTAAFFTNPWFSKDADDRVYPYYWAYWICFAVMTLMVPSIWLLVTYRIEKKKRRENNEKPLKGFRERIGFFFSV